MNREPQRYTVTCIRCNSFLFRTQDLTLYNYHGEIVTTFESYPDVTCMISSNQNLMFLENDEFLPVFIRNNLARGGESCRISCPNNECPVHIGRFVPNAGRACACVAGLLHPIRITMSQVNFQQIGKERSYRRRR